MTSTVEAALSNAGSSVNFSSWTAAQLKAATNISNYAPSAKDLVMAGPRMAMKLGSFARYTIPGAFDNALGLGMAQRVIAEATGAGGSEIAATAAAAALGNMVDAGETIAEINNGGGGYTGSLTLDSVRNFGGLFNYATSKWALMCVFMAVALNRTYVYSSTRRNLTLGWKARLALRITPIVLFAVQSISLLQSIQCQTSPDFAELRWGNASRSSELLFTQNGGLFHTISQNMLLGASDKASCQAIGMIAPDLAEDGDREYIIPIGSFQRLWPLFETLCFSQFVETVSCAVQGRLVAAETGMTLFEHSLAFAEAEANVNSIAGLGTTSKSTSSSGFTYTFTPEKNSAEAEKQRTALAEALNTAPEILFISFISSMNHLTSHILGVFNMQGRLRLFNTGLWGLAFMGIISWSFFAFSGADDGNHSLLRFPTVCIVGFVPHMLVLAGITLCCVIYFFALIFTALASPSTIDGHRLSWYEKFKAAHGNLQADIPMSSIRVSMHMDFYTALLKSGFQALTMASEAVYLNESRGVSIKGTTWLEEERLAEMDENGADWLGPSFRSHSDTSNEMLNAMDMLQNSTSGFARERTAKKLSRRQRPVQDGVGAAQRTGRWIMAADFFTGIVKLLVGLWAKSIIRSLSILNIHWRPQWLLGLAGQKKKGDGSGKNAESANVTLDFWLINNNGELTLPVDEHVDIELEMRKRLTDGQDDWDVLQESNLDSSLYNWWLRGGWWGADDSSGDFRPPTDLDEDTTSVISMSTNRTTGSDWKSDSGNDDGRRTPTQRSPNFTRESTPVNDTPLNVTDLARLLHPQTPEQRAESETLASHMASDMILTRSRYRSLHQQKRARVLTSSRIRPSGFRPSNPSGRLTPAEEAEILEHLIVTRRAAKASSGPSSWAQGAAGMGEGGPQCVVCQSSPRSIIVWPCRCLSLCDDCRVTLAMNNYEKCVCCRSNVNSFSRIFVP